MEFKIPKYSSNTSGFTLVEVLISLGIIMVLVSSAVFFINVPQAKARSRDLTRFSDIAILERAIADYRDSTRSCPDSPDTLRVSTLIPQGSIYGWMNHNWNNLIVRLPIDPLNNETYYYSYFCDGLEYELNMRPEYYTERASGDGGDNPELFETGTNLNLIN